MDAYAESGDEEVRVVRDMFEVQVCTSSAWQTLFVVGDF